MRRDVDISEISDGRFYTSADMVKADTLGCAGCSACCHGMGQSVLLDPYDFYRLHRQGKGTFAELMQDGKVELTAADALVLPCLVMKGPEEACAFLNEEGRCSIHGARPGFCRMFPLGRYYQGDEFRYFLQIHECPRAGKVKVKVKKWLDQPDLSDYEAYISSWHGCLEKARQLVRASSDENLQRTISMALLEVFYSQAWNKQADFYGQYQERLQLIRRKLGYA